MPSSHPPAATLHSDEAAAPRAVASGGLDVADAAYASLFAALAVWSWVGICLAEAGRFYLSWLIMLAAPASALAAASAWRSLRTGGRRTASPSTIVAIVAVTALASWLAARPGEFLVDGDDGSVYLNIGRGLARHHALIHPEPLLDLMPPSDWEGVFWRERYPPRVFNLFPGGIQVYPGTNAVQPNFFHLFPVWVAIADVIGGPRASYYVSPVFSVVAIVAFWLLTRALASALVATLASLLLLANLAQIWFARVPTTEIMAQAFTLSGVYFAVCCYRRPEATLGVLCAAAFGLAAFVRVDVLMFVTPLVVGFAFLVALERRWARPWTWCAVMLAVLTAHAVVHAVLVSAPYTERILFHLTHSRSVTMASRLLPPLVLAAGAVALLLSKRFRGSLWAGRAAVSVFVVILAAAAYRIWPQVTSGFLLMLMSPLGVGLALAGAVLWLVDDRSPPTLLVIGLLLTSALVYGESVRDRSNMPMLLRRFVPVVLPLSALAVGMLIDRVWRRGVIWRVVAMAGWAALVAIWMSHARPLIGATPMVGVHEQIARLAAGLPDAAIVVTDQTTPSHFGLSLHGSFQRDVLWVRPTASTAAVLERLARRAARPLVIARGPSGPAEGVLTGRDLVGFTLSPARVETLQMTQMEATADRLPSAIVTRASTIEFYIARPREATAWPATVEIGAADLSARLDGFYDAEQMGEASARWTRDQAQMQLPRLQPVAHATLVLRLAAPRAATMPSPLMHVSLDGVEIGVTPALGPGFQLAEMPLPGWSLTRLTAGPSVLTLSTPTFVPAEHGMGGDTRQLGAVVDWIRLVNSLDDAR